MLSNNTSYFHTFKENISHLDIPTRLNYPFAYTPYPIARAAARQVQDYLTTQQDFTHNFGLGNEAQSNNKSIGKMFGVLVVKNPKNEIGFIAAVSGKLADSNVHKYFVPPVYDMLTPDSFFLKGEVEISAINQKIATLESNPEIQKLSNLIFQKEKTIQKKLSDYRSKMKIAKRERREIRNSQQALLSSDDYELLLKDLIRQSYRDQHEYKVYKQQLESKLEEDKSTLETLKKEINDLKSLRKEKSSQLQQRIFDQYTFLDSTGESKSLSTIFTKELGILPTSGAGECAAPKLFQYAFIHNLQPIALAEFWWGAPPNTEVRKHKNYYACCRGKCEPILNYMLQHLPVDPNPMLTPPRYEGDPIEIIYEDEALLAINKAAEFLSVPGIHVKDSALKRVEEMFSKDNPPLLLHRLDMSTSGVLLFAKSKDYHKHIQNQFLKRTIHKEYIALLDGDIENDKGEINLPLRVDLNDRPRQVVCYQYGKKSLTYYQVINRHNGITRVRFIPISGRTHQLRVHAAHQLGLATAIVGDDLYGTPSERLHLHAHSLTFDHPATGKRTKITSPCPF